MASGLPDYYRGMDVAYQALAEMVVRPKYGGALAEASELVVTGSVLNTLFTVAGKGMIYGGYLWVDYTSSQKDSIVKLEIDGEVLLGESFNGMNIYGVKRPGSFVESLFTFDEINYRYAVGLCYGITFETSLKMHYHELHATTPIVSWRVIYALI